MRRATLSVINYRIDTFRRQRWAVFMWLFLILIGLWLTVTDSPWWALAVLLFAWFLSYYAWMPRRLRSRRSLLADRTVLPY